MRVPPRRSPTVVVALVLAAALVVTGCTSTGVEDRTEVADAAVSVTGLDPVALLTAVPRSAASGWRLDDGGPVPVSLDDVRLGDPDRAARYAEAGFRRGARLTLSRGDVDRIAVMVDRFAHAAAARQVEDWHLTTTGTTLVDGVSRVGATAEGVVVLDDLLVRVVAVGEEAPDEVVVRRLLDAIQAIVRPRA